ncbi:hypothetical protein QOZ83_16955 [Romboutsia sedimentorum]|uniref:hypothetical protein n=1 Tax=Romboutsia sedimentorum TaxID=1368474 RepID=UPI0024DEBDE5|nr:hypothetical protein [Romboutsia sedimentorum]MDK2587530.1 hypothetical protein [Romboutsia sedimentorum]
MNNDRCTCNNNDELCNDCGFTTICQIGPTGPTGPQGETGPIGPTGYTGATGFLASAYVSANLRTNDTDPSPIASNVVIPLPGVSIQPTSLATSSGDGNITMNENGTYLILWYLIIANSAADIRLFINGVAAPSPNTIKISPGTSGFISTIASLSNGDTVSLRPFATSATLDFATLVAANHDVVALQIIKLS